MRSDIRRGSILIVVVGMVAIMAGICLTFLAKARIEAQQMNVFNRTAQARIMLAAACAYVQETSRLGWDDPATVAHEEAFGWVDVRDGQPGPRTGEQLAPATYDGSGRLLTPIVYRTVIASAATDAAGRPLWPNIGARSRHPLYRMVKPPYAISPDVTPNAIENDPAKPLFGLPLLRKPDPMPSISTSYADFATGDPALVTGTAGRGWFRLYRDGPATFVVTVGSGGTQGFRDWPEVVALSNSSLFIGGQDSFEQMLGEEVRLWYRIEWSSAISISIPTAGDGSKDHGDWASYPNTGITAPWATYANQGGTIQWIQRLRAPPEVW